MQEELIERYGVGVVRRGGLQDPHDDPARAAGRRPRGDQRVLRRPGRALLGDRGGRPLHRQDPRDGVERHLRRAPLQPRRPGPPPARLGVQDVRPDGGDPRRASTRTRRATPRSRSTSTTPTYGHWEVKTFGNSYSGTVSLTRATLASDNTVYAQLILDLGPEKVCKAAKLLGITTKLDCYPAEGLGGLTRGVTTLEMANAYATLASGGIRHKATGIERVVFPDGKSETARQPEGQARDDRRAGLRGHEDPRDERDLGDRHRRGLRLPGGRQDGDDRRGQGRLVRGLYARACRRRSGSAIRTRASRCRAPRAEPTPRPSGTPSCCPRSDGNCDDFPLPTEAFVSSPFFGKYSSTGEQLRRRLRRRLLDGPATPSRPTAPTAGRVRPEPLRVRPAAGARRAGAARAGRARAAGGRRHRRSRRVVGAALAELELIAAIEAALERPQRPARALDG